MRESPDDTVDASRVTVVTVTYGERRHFLEPMLRAVLAQGVGNIVLVNNGSRWDVAGLAAEIDSTRIEVLHLGQNQGSAIGIAAGIVQTRKSDAELIWLLDDDNYPASDCLRLLLLAYGESRAQLPPNNFAVLAFRTRFHSSLGHRIPLSVIKTGAGTFWGFRIRDLPAKLWRRRPWRTIQLNVAPPKVEIPFAPYGGLMFHRSVIDAIGLPKRELVLYEDDTEFTWRLTQQGGRIHLIPDARIVDMDFGWNEVPSHKNAIWGWLEEGGDFRAYYRARNLTWFEMRCMHPPKIAHVVHKWTYLALLYAMALTRGRRSRFKLLLRAIDDGEKGQLGINPEFPLP